MQVCISLQADNHASTHHSSFFTGQIPFLTPNQQCQSTEGISKQLDINNDNVTDALAPYLWSPQSTSWHVTTIYRNADMHYAIGSHGFGKTFLHNNNSNNSNHDNVYGAIIMTKVIARVHLAHLMNVD